MNAVMVSEEESSRHLTASVQNHEMTVTIHYVSSGAPSRATLLTSIALKISCTLRNVNKKRGEHRSPDYLKKNPQHTIPLLEDGDFCIWDSHAINAYLANKYAEEDNLYPSDPRKRAIVDQRLHFDNGVLFPCIQKLTRAVKAKTVTHVTAEIVREYEENYDFVEKFLQGSKYVAGNNITIADFSFVASLETMNAVVPMNEKRFPSVKKYLALCKSEILQYKEINEAGVKDYINLLKEFGFNFPLQ